MRYCTRCGQPIKPEAMFCANCGAPVTLGDATNDATRMASPPAPVTPVAPAATSMAPSAGDSARRKLMIMIAAVIVVIALVVAGIVTKGFGAWSERQIPQIDASAKASDVVAKLESSGIHVKRAKAYGAAKQGEYLRLDGYEPGEHVGRDETVTVVESLGPGVPEGTVGMDKEKPSNGCATWASKS